MSLEDVVSQFHGLLTVQLAVLSGEHERQESVAAPVDMRAVSPNKNFLCHIESYLGNCVSTSLLFISSKWCYMFPISRQHSHWQILFKGCCDLFYFIFLNMVNISQIFTYLEWCRFINVSSLYSGVQSDLGSQRKSVLSPSALQTSHSLKEGWHSMRVPSLRLTCRQVQDTQQLVNFIISRLPKRQGCP